MLTAYNLVVVGRLTNNGEVTVSLFITRDFKNS